MADVVVMRLATFDRSGELRELASADAAQAVIDQFGHALAVEQVEDSMGVALLVTCPEQRGLRGAYRLHSLACDRQIPVSVR
uniref:hypothetical protein n=1 Tax=Paractinoplanes polyasparticus TaxID=2856853 RepID=UPI001C84A15B|nr:hypothetical protein [Actinoplanes polyasparticus]